MVIASMLLSSMLFSGNLAFALVELGEDPPIPISTISANNIGADIDFIFTGTGSGNLGQTNFGSSDFTITLWANTGDVMMFGSGFLVQALEAEVVIDGVGMATITDPVVVFANHNTDSIGINKVGDVDIYDLFSVPNTYELDTDFGPVFSNNLVFQIPVGTDAGDFFIIDPTNGSFEAQLKAAIGGEMIPLDATMVLVAGTHTAAAWMIPVIVSAIGIAIVIARKF